MSGNRFDGFAWWGGNGRRRLGSVEVVTDKVTSAR